MAKKGRRARGLQGEDVCTWGYQPDQEGLELLKSKQQTENFASQWTGLPSVQEDTKFRSRCAEQVDVHL